MVLVVVGCILASCREDLRTSSEQESVQVNSSTSIEQEEKTVWKKAPYGEQTEDFLKRFFENPSEVMNEIPAKISSNPSKLEEEKGDWFAAKQAVREEILKRDHEMKSDFRMEGLESSDLAEHLVDQPELLETQLEVLEQKGLLSAKLSEQPWSDDYWSLKQGVLGYRYADQDMVSENTGDEYSWPKLFDYIQKNTASEFIQQGKVDLLSPSEKYDLLVGDRDYSLTKNMWNEGKSYYDDQGKVESWMGICHGWAPAAYMLARPTQSVEVKAVDGTIITFYPADIKSLGTLLWARNEFPTKAIGNRCDIKNPKKDGKGRILDQVCFDTNPGTWHLSVVHQIAVAKRSFIIDATYDYEVWNQPVLSYSYQYFHPQNGKVKKSLKDAMIPIQQFKKDPFKSHRSQEAAYVVGISMKVSYLAETTPSQQATDSSDRDSVTEVVYRYDLELDQQGHVIGGEWYSNAHPDFLWTPREKTRILTQWDRTLRGQWTADKTESFRKEWTESARNASRSLGTPLARVVEALFRVSSSR
jgi:hypothetical protein